MNKSLQTLFPFMHTAFGCEGVALDVGAHEGLFSKFLIDSGLFSKIIAFEPNPKSYKILKEQLSTSPSCPVETVNIGLSDHQTQLDLYCDEDTATASLLPYANEYRTNGTVQQYRISVDTLDQYLACNLPNQPIHFLKIDTQGHDLSVIMGAQSTLTTYRPVLQLEFIYVSLYQNQCSPAVLTEKLSELGYRLYSLNNLHVTQEGRLAFCDALFIPDEWNIPCTQQYTCIDNLISLETQIQILNDICRERGSVIERLDQEVKFLQNQKPGERNNLKNFIRRFF